MSDLISVIVPVYNVEQYLEKCVDSIKNQSYPHLEILLIDDGATDSSGQLCDTLAETDSRIKVFHKANGGLSDARNYGLQHASGAFILFLDSDDYIHPHMIESLYEQMIKEDADVSVCNVMNVYETGESPQCENPELYFVMNTDEFLKEYLIGKLVPGSICNKLIRKEIANQLRFPIGKIYEDAFYHYDLIQVANKYVVNTKPYYYYYHRGNSITTSTFSKRDFNYIEIYTKFSRYVEEHYPDLQEEMFFRLSYAYFFIFDKLLHVEGYQKLEEYKVVRDYLKQNAIKIANNQIFQKGRRLAALFLKVNVHLYRFVMLANERKTKQIH